MAWWQVALAIAVVVAVAVWQLWDSLATLRGIARTRRTLAKAVTSDRARVQQAYETALANYRRHGTLTLEDEVAFASFLPLAESCFSKEFCDGYRALKAAFAEGRAGRRSEADREIARLARELEAGFGRETG